jgi:GH43 family beta-xylosidase
MKESGARMQDNEKEFYANPIMAEGADPWVIQTGGYYYLCGSDGERCIYLTKAMRPQDFSFQERNLIYQAPEGTEYSHEIWAPELHFAEGRWYIYYAADDGKNENHRMYVLRGGSNELDPMDGIYNFLGKISDVTDRWAIDGTLLSLENQLYFVWSGWEGEENVCQNIYIARMSNPYTISSPRVCISTPDRDWEKVGTPFVNEGPEVLSKGNTIHIIYSASGSWTNDYCLGRLTCEELDVMKPESWKKEGPVFAKSDPVFGPGHGSFIKSPNGSQDYIVYHAAKRDGSGWDRNIRMQSFVWEQDTPVFGRPVPEGTMLEW